MLWPGNIHKKAFFKGTHSEKITSKDDSVALADFSKSLTINVFWSNLLSKKSMANVTNPVRERVKL